MDSNLFAGGRLGKLFQLLCTTATSFQSYSNTQVSHRETSGKSHFFEEEVKDATEVKAGDEVKAI